MVVPKKLTVGSNWTQTGLVQELFSLKKVFKTARPVLIWLQPTLILPVLMLVLKWDWYRSRCHEHFPKVNIDPTKNQYPNWYLKLDFQERELLRNRAHLEKEPLVPSKGQKVPDPPQRNLKAKIPMKPWASNWFKTWANIWARLSSSDSSRNFYSNATLQVYDGKPIRSLWLYRKTPNPKFKPWSWTSCGVCGQLCRITDEKLPNLWICWDISPSKFSRMRKRSRILFKKRWMCWNRKTPFWQHIPIQTFMEAYLNLWSLTDISKLKQFHNCAFRFFFYWYKVRTAYSFKLMLT